VTRRRLAAGGLLAVIVVSAAGAASGAVRVPPVPAATSGDPSPAPAQPDTATIEQRTLHTAADLTGTLGYEGTSAVDAGTGGTLTWLPAEGTVISRNGVLYELDGRIRPRLLYGARPMWRSLGPGVSDGADVRQLEENLRAMGYAPSNMKVDAHWDARTTTAVKRWQKATGRTADGMLDSGDIAFLPGPVRVASHQATLGSRVGPGMPLLSTTGTKRVVTLDLSASRQDLVRAGQAVTVTLPDGTMVSGHVRGVGRVATAGQNGAPATVPVTFDLDPAAKLPDLDAAPVTVHVVTEEHPNVLAAPVTALVALLEGGYAVEVVHKDGTHAYVAVTTGLFEDGWVEVNGNGLAAGDTVVVAR
jgi:peptidoglycan hydrolase-like protein with peptidoglycan-binding domain